MTADEIQAGLENGSLECNSYSIDLNEDNCITLNHCLTYSFNGTEWHFAYEGNYSAKVESYTLYNGDSIDITIPDDTTSITVELIEER